MEESLLDLQQRICRTFGAAFDPPAQRSKVGIALHTLDRVPIHGVRLMPTDTTSGWYIYAGDAWSNADDFYQPLCVEHLGKYCKFALPFICLPPGWHFMTDHMGFIDVWYDPDNAGSGTQPV